MTTATNDQVVVDARGLVVVCAWCVPANRLRVLHDAHACTDTICPACAARLEGEL
jgi:hypothetical protein